MTTVMCHLNSDERLRLNIRQEADGKRILTLDQPSRSMTLFMTSDQFQEITSIIQRHIETGEEIGIYAGMQMEAVKC